MGNNLRKLRKERGWTQEQTAEAMGTTRDTYVKLERGVEKGGRKLHDLWIAKAAAAFGVDPSEIIASDRAEVPIVGFVSAGAVENNFTDAQGEFDRAPAPQGATAETVAVEVRGDSLGPFFDGALVFYDKIEAAPTPAMIGRLCIVGTKAGNVYIKKIGRGTREDRWTLYAQFGSPMEDVEIEWVAPVIDIRPR